eukprot:jgi/Ulvmu1/5406/UM022_0201.1
MTLAKSLEQYSSNELDDLLKLVGVRQHILSRAHIDGFRLVRLSNAQVMGLPFTPMERWKLQLVRTSDTVFKIFTRGQRSAGACPIYHICAMLRHTFGYSSLIVDEIKQVMLAHTDAGIRGDRLITFDQWAQLFEWISSTLDLSTPEKLNRRMGSYISVKPDDAGRTPLQAKHCSGDEMPCMPLHQPSAAGPSCMHMPELFRDILNGEDSLASPTSTLQEESAQNSGSPAAASTSRSSNGNMHALQALRAAGGVASLEPQGQPTALRTGARALPIPAAWMSVRTGEPEPRRQSSVSPPPLIIAAQSIQPRLPHTLRPVPPRLQVRLQGLAEVRTDMQTRSRSPPRRRLTPTPSDDAAGRDREPVVGLGWRSGSEGVQARLPALLSWMHGSGAVAMGRRSSRDSLQAFAARNQDNATQGQIISQSR